MRFAWSRIGGHLDVFLPFWKLRRRLTSLRKIVLYWIVNSRIGIPKPSLKWKSSSFESSRKLAPKHQEYWKIYKCWSGNSSYFPSFTLSPPVLQTTHRGEQCSNWGNVFWGLIRRSRVRREREEERSKPSRRCASRVTCSRDSGFFETLATLWSGQFENSARQIIENELKTTKHCRL